MWSVLEHLTILVYVRAISEWLFLYDTSVYFLAHLTTVWHNRRLHCLAEAHNACTQDHFG